MESWPDTLDFTQKWTYRQRVIMSAEIEGEGGTCAALPAASQKAMITMSN